MASSSFNSDVHSKSKTCVQLVDLDPNKKRIILGKLFLKSSIDISANVISKIITIARDCFYEKFVLVQEKNCYGTEYLKYMEIYILVDLFSLFFSLSLSM